MTCGPFAYACMFSLVNIICCTVTYLPHLFHFLCPKWILYFEIQIARRLLGKILIDLRNTREEAISVTDLKSNQDGLSSSKKAEKEDTEYKSNLYVKNDDLRRTSTASDVSMDQDDDDDKETQYRLDAQ